MKARFLWSNLTGHAMAGEIVEEVYSQSMQAPYLIIKVEVCESRQDIKLVGQKLFVAKSRCEIGDFKHV